MIQIDELMQRTERLSRLLQVSDLDAAAAAAQQVRLWADEVADQIETARRILKVPAAAKVGG